MTAGAALAAAGCSSTPVQTVGRPMQVPATVAGGARPASPSIWESATPAPPSATPPSAISTCAGDGFRSSLCTPAAFITFSPAGVGLAADSTIDATNALAATIVRSVDGGRDWSVVWHGAGVTDVQWINAAHAVLATTAGLEESADAGLTWHAMASLPLARVRFATTLVGLAITSDDRLVRTTDGGRHLLPVDPGLQAAAVELLSSGRAWVAGPAGIAASADFGVTWSRQRTFPMGSCCAQPGDAPYFQWPAHIHFSDDLHGGVLFRSWGTAMNQDGKGFYQTSDGGRSWILEFADGFIPNPTGEVARGMSPGFNVNPDFAVHSPSTALFLDSDPVTSHPRVAACQSTDAGAHSVCAALPGLPEGFTGAGGATWLGDEEWVVADDESQLGGTSFLILASTDGGAHWSVRFRHS